MKFVALLSGGKDSVFCIEKCMEYGHELVCVANLYPPVDPDRNGDEINSYMYQSAAFSAIPMQAECLGVPLVRREILGQAHLQTLNYEVTNDDETEDLYELLRDVLTKFPDVKGVSCGTIISSYQRFRVENTCERLGLTPLSYLWQRDRGELLQEMLIGGLEAVLVKTAGAGLVPDKHLGKTLQQLYPTLLRLHDRFELDLCGEGGEYESLVLDSRAFKKTLVLTDTIIDYDAEDESVGCLRVLSCEAQMKEGCLDSENDKLSKATPSTLPVLCQPFFTSRVPTLLPVSPLVQSPLLRYQPRLSFCTSGLCQTGLLLPVCEHLSPSVSPAEQLHSVFQGLSGALVQAGYDIKDSVFVHLYVADMNQFESINQEYRKWFGNNPPSRSCIQSSLPQGTHVAVECLVLLGSHEPRFLGVKTEKKEVLHVRSVSAWAPVCIGPYAQANVIHDSIIFVAGQIALQPSTMTMLSDSNDSIVPWHIDFVNYVIHDSMLLSNVAISSKSIMTFMLRELFLSLHHVNSILSAIAGNTPSLALTPSAILNLVVYVDVIACANKYLNSLPSTDKVGVEKQVVVDEVLSLLSALKQCAVLYVRMFASSVKAYKMNKSKREDESQSDSDSDSDDEDKNDAVQLIPVLVVGAEKLPRGALVEAEIVGTTEALQNKERIVDTSVGDSGCVGECGLSVDRGESVLYDKSLCSGSFSVVAAPFSGSNEISVNPWIIADLAIQHLKTRLASIDVAHLRIVKVFVAKKYDSLIYDIKASLVQMIGRILGCFDIDPIVIPVTALESNCHIISVQYLSVDLLQLKI